jgi:hypothetical protein
VAFQLTSVDLWTRASLDTPGGEGDVVDSAA